MIVTQQRTRKRRRAPQRVDLPEVFRSGQWERQTSTKTLVNWWYRSGRGGQRDLLTYHYYGRKEWELEMWAPEKNRWLRIQDTNPDVVAARYITYLMTGEVDDDS